MIGSDAHDGAVLLVQAYVILLKVAFPDSIEVPERCESGPKWTGDGLEGREEGADNPDGELDANEEREDQKIDVAIHGGYKDIAG